MRLVYPADTFKPKNVDEVYAEEHAVALDTGFPISLFNFEDFQAGRFKLSSGFEAGEPALYRGWMLTAADYQRLHTAFKENGGCPVTAPESYLLCHHLPQWYPLLQEFTAETRFYSEGDDIAEDLASAGWNGCFLKDYVKSLSTDGGSLIRDLSTIPSVIAKMRKYRGSIEGGLCARRIESYAPESERRFFVCRGKVYSDGDSPPPKAVFEAANRISSPFFTVDVAQKSDGAIRIIELGDGQVSDRKHWSGQNFIRMLEAFS